MKEKWETVKGFGGHYEASSLGRIRSKIRVVKKYNPLHGKVLHHTYDAKILIQRLDDDGYFKVSIGVDGKKYTPFVHSLVLLAFFEEPQDGMEGRHLDGISKNNFPKNLKWGTHLENMQDRKKHGNYRAGQNHVMAKLTKEQVLEARTKQKGISTYAREFGVSYTAVWDCINGRSWTHL